jgi:hypothetical protein
MKLMADGFDGSDNLKSKKKLGPMLVNNILSKFLLI